MIISFVLVAMLIGLDQLTKHLATAYLAPVGVRPFIPGVMELRYARNDGAAFSLLASAAWGRTFLIVVTTLALAALAVWFIRKKPNTWWERWTFILIFSGGMGNLIDRIAHGSVVDFFVCIGAGLLALLMLRQELCAARASGGDSPQKTV